MNKIVNNALLSIEKNPQSPYLFCTLHGAPWHKKKAVDLLGFEMDTIWTPGPMKGKVAGNNDIVKYHGESKLS